MSETIDLPIRAPDDGRFREARCNDAQAIVCACLMDDPRCLESLQGVTRSDFSVPWFGRLFELLCERINAGQPVDLFTLSLELPAEWLEAGGGRATLIQIQDRASPSLLQLAVKTIREFSAERRIGFALDEARTMLEADEPISQRLDRIVTLLGGLEKQQAARKGPQRLSDVVLERTRHYEDLEAGRVEAGMSVGIPTLDHMLGGGLRCGAVYVLAARPGIGKSSLAQQFAMHVAKRGHVSLLLSQEMPAGEIADRALANLAGVDYADLTQGRTKGAWEAIVEAADDLGSVPVWVDDQEALTLAVVRQKAREVKGLQVLVVDYLQLMQGSGAKSEGNRNSEIEVISRGLKALAKQLGIAVVLLSQLNRQVESRQSKRPMASDLRDSGSIEQDADVVLLLWQHREMQQGQRVIGVRVDKNRQGRKGDVALHFDGPRQRWGESTESLDEPQRGRGEDL